MQVPTLMDELKNWFGHFSGRGSCPVSYMSWWCSRHRCCQNKLSLGIFALPFQVARFGPGFILALDSVLAEGQRAWFWFYSHQSAHPVCGTLCVLIFIIPQRIRGRQKHWLTQMFGVCTRHIPIDWFHLRPPALFLLLLFHNFSWQFPLN